MAVSKLLAKNYLTFLDGFDRTKMSYNGMPIQECIHIKTKLQMEYIETFNFIFTKKLSNKIRDKFNVEQRTKRRNKSASVSQPLLC